MLDAINMIIMVCARGHRIAPDQLQSTCIARSRYHSTIVWRSWIRHCWIWHCRLWRRRYWTCCCNHKKFQNLPIYT